MYFLLFHCLPVCAESALSAENNGEKRPSIVKYGYIPSQKHGIMLSGDGPPCAEPCLGDCGHHNSRCLLCAEPAWRLQHDFPKRESSRTSLWAEHLQAKKGEGLKHDKMMILSRGQHMKNHEALLDLFKGFGKLRATRDISDPPLSQEHNYSQQGSGPSEDKLTFSEPPVKHWFRCFQLHCCKPSSSLFLPTALGLMPYTVLLPLFSNTLTLPGSKEAKTCKAVKPHNPETPLSLLEGLTLSSQVEHIWGSGDV